MDPMQFAALSRARTALDVAVANECSSARAKAFVEIALGMMLNGKNFRTALASHPSALVQKAVAESTFGEVWQNQNAAALAASYIGSIAEGSLLDQIIPYGSVLPLNVSSVLVGTGYSANVTKEGDPKVVKNLQLGTEDVELQKAAAIVVMTQELVRAIGGQTIFESELRKSVTRAINSSVLAQLLDNAPRYVAPSGDPLANLRAGMFAAGPSDGYVVAAPAVDVMDLATRLENRGGMGLRGGTFIPGVQVVAMDEIADMYVIPASRIAIRDQGLEVRSAGHALISLADTPTSPAQMVSLFQTNSIALLAERNFHLAAASPMVVVGEEPAP
ncbi:hypothetical protein ABQZ69_03725 [Xanthomonas sp. WHRI 8391]|uniref:Uncharacterized protein n=2 Tax=Xanthomonas hortorum TaxID=56454 RepID=A0A6V7D544_9XANT|nr:MULTISPECIES: hypothetical protein [Xanthomonas]ETC87686.1 hypothetical protein XHC_2839 [Xanthomonas hortorum pv. carotae str. M081]CAD0328093.1 hypothetical protein CFBP7900_17640 [Xanthomonas hortorum pv. carotae]MEA9794458.1 hypothetical protein [Xanthomonas campestris pv. raphani]UTS72710.1 hypothetical protein NMB96_20110 [Xanthomonas hortorum]CAD0328102.1 hypothetical protein CFBP7900_17640 [Xanthomonas hortorum pv. carotae]